MIKRVSVDQLVPGMYIHDFRAGWLGHPFLTNQLKLKDEGQIRKIVTHGIRFVYIDTGRGLDVQDAPSESEVQESVETGLVDLAEASTSLPKKVELHVELEKARAVRREAKTYVSNLLEEVRLGKAVEVEKAENIVSNMVDSILRNQNALVSLSGIRAKDEYTFMHSVGVCALMVSFCSSVGLDRDFVVKAGIGALLHDIGKVKTPVNILNSRFKLSAEEFEIMKQHVVYSRELISAVSGIDPLSVTIAAQHHERYNGSGYPTGLKGDAISKIGQMIAVVDVYDAMTSDRCYQTGMQPSEVVRRIFEWSGTHFRRDVVEEFIKCVGIYPIGTLVRLESGLLAFVVDFRSDNLLAPTVRVVYDTRKNWQVSPYDLDLAEKGKGGSSETIRGYESPQKWGLEARNFLEQFKKAD